MAMNKCNEGTCNANNTQNPHGEIVLGIYMHCPGCSGTVIKSLRGFEGVEQIETDLKNHKVTVKGKRADPKKVFERLKKKTGKHVTLISPILKEKKEEKEQKKEEPKIVEVVLKVCLHCEGCADDIKRRIHKMQGVYTVTTDMKNSHVTVKGTFEPGKLVEYICKRAGKHAVIIKQTPPECKKGQKNEKEGEKIDLQMYYQIYPPGLVYAPQIFSDENPNACSVM